MLTPADQKRTTDTREEGGADVGGLSAQREPLPTARPHLASLDGLRGVAILMVMMIHVSQLVRGLSPAIRDFTFYGVRGVQLFFVVSGFTLALNYAGKPFRPLNFAARRYFRIAPMFYLGVVLYLLLARLTAAPLPTRDAGVTDVIETLLFVHGWFPHAINLVVPGGWSIAAEAMFYIAFPALLPLVMRPRAMSAALLIALGISGVTNLALRRIFAGAGGNEFALYFWVVQLPAFVGGCWLAALARADLLPRRMATMWLAATVVALVIDTQLRGRSNLLVAIALLTAFAGLAIAARPRWLERDALVLIGQISFSLYIVHFAVIAALQPLAPGIEAVIGANAALLALFIITLGLAGALAWCSYRWIELPAMRWARDIGRREAKR